LKPSSILLTGANGFTGQHLMHLGKSLGHNLNILKANINDVDVLEAEIASLSPDYVIHLAGISFVASKDHEAFYRVHALGTGNLLKALIHLPTAPKKILLASSATVYGNSSNPFSIETQALEPVDHYAISKVAMEEMAKTYFERLPIVIARPFNYTGVGQKGDFLIPKLIRHFANQLPFIELGNLNVEREFNDVLTICSAYLNLLELGEPGEIYNVCTGQARSLQFVLDSLSELSGYCPEIRVNPDFVRASEVSRMCGNPKKLQDLLTANGINLIIPALNETILSMLVEAKNGSQKI
jgi:nucleoside-diphosphate-sugar epimerase